MSLSLHASGICCLWPSRTEKATSVTLTCLLLFDLCNLHWPSSLRSSRNRHGNLAMCPCACSSILSNDTFHALMVTAILCRTSLHSKLMTCTQTCRGYSAALNFSGCYGRSSLGGGEDSPRIEPIPVSSISTSESMSMSISVHRYTYIHTYRQTDRQTDVHKHTYREVYTWKRCGQST